MAPQYLCRFDPNNDTCATVVLKMMMTRDTASTLTWLIAVIMIYCVSSQGSYLSVTLDWSPVHAQVQSYFFWAPSANDHYR